MKYILMMNTMKANREKRGDPFMGEAGLARPRCFYVQTQ
jgi:hypothetical protein